MICLSSLFCIFGNSLSPGNNDNHRPILYVKAEAFQNRFIYAHGYIHAGGGNRKYKYEHEELKRASLNSNKKAWLLAKPFVFNPAATYFPMTLAIIVSSALKSLTSVFGMGTGVAPSALPPENLISRQI
jgi:hypothetical protein